MLKEAGAELCQAQVKLVIAKLDVDLLSKTNEFNHLPFKLNLGHLPFRKISEVVFRLEEK
jgi:hypothetical protein